MTNLYAEDIKERLFVEAYNAAKMEDILPEVVHERWEDLVVVYRLSGYDARFKRDCALVTNEQLAYWGVDAETLNRDAWTNMMAKRPPFLSELGEHGPIDINKNYLEKATPLQNKKASERVAFILSNYMDDRGAIYMLDGETIQKVAEKLGCNLIILPASVHETIICSDELGLDLRRVKDHVKAINKTVLKEDEYLSGEIYRYDKDSHTLSIVQVPEHDKVLMPDSISMEEMYAYGYAWDGMLPLCEDKALELLDEGLPLFRLYEDGSEGMLETREEIFAHNGLFGVERETWMEYLKVLSQKEQNEIMEDMTMVM